MAANAHTELGSPDDRVSLLINGQKLPNYCNYNCKLGIIQQPGTFSVTLGAGRPGKDAMTAGELMRLAAPRSTFELKVGATLVQSGIVEDRDISDSGGTTVKVSGRDWLFPLVKNHVEYEVDFGQPTYFELARKVLDICGLQDRKLYGDNDANRKSISRSVKAKAKPISDVVENIPTNTLSNTNTKVNIQRIIGKIGNSWWDFLRDQNKKVGLYLWATADGNFVLSRPTGSLDPLYKIVKKRGLPRTMTQAVTRTLSDKTSTRHAEVKCYGKGANHAKGVHKMERSWSDWEMKAYGFSDLLAIYDEDAETPNDAEYIAKRKTAEERRDSWVLNYTVSGHTVPGLSESGKMLVWTPDTCCTVFDEDLGDLLEAYNSSFGTGQDCYIESVELSRSPQTTTKLRVMRKQDMYYLGEESVFESDETRPIGRGQ